MELIDNRQQVLEQYAYSFSFFTGVDVSTADIQSALDAIENITTENLTTSQLLKEF